MTPIELMVQVISEHEPENIWIGSPLIGYRNLDMTNRGGIGEEFVRRFLKSHGIQTGNGNRASKMDMTIGKVRFEVKTASLGAKGTFQFNHVRLDRQYDYLLCLGICPNEILFDRWRKGEVAEEKSGHLVRMAEGQSVTYKITKKREDLMPIDMLPEYIEERKIK